MKSRCYNDNDESYKNYGGRGIYVADDWLNNPNDFYSWYVEHHFDRCQIDRIDNDGPYSKENCRLVTATENGRNKRNTLFIEAFGESKPLVAWIEDDRCYEKNYNTLLHRLEFGVPPEIAMSKDYDEYRGNKISRTKRDKSKQLEAFGEYKSLKDWSEDERCTVAYKTLWARMNYGWTLEEALVGKK